MRVRSSVQDRPDSKLDIFNHFDQDDQGSKGMESPDDGVTVDLRYRMVETPNFASLAISIPMMLQGRFGVT